MSDGVSAGSKVPSDTDTIVVPMEVQKLLIMNCSTGARPAGATAPAIDMTSMLNSTAKQAIQANANRCRDMSNSMNEAIRPAI